MMGISERPTQDVESACMMGIKERPTKDVESTRMRGIRSAAKRRDLLHELRRNEPHEAQLHEEEVTGKFASTPFCRPSQKKGGPGPG